ncbi:lysoplasmalogenase family protein [Shigella flexneri]
MTFTFFWPTAGDVAGDGALLRRRSGRAWKKGVAELTFIGMTLVMVWLAGQLWFFRPTDTGDVCVFWCRAVVGRSLVWLVSHYRRRFRADNAISAACYFAGHFFIVRSLFVL